MAGTMTTEHSQDGGLPRLIRSLDLLWGRTGKDRPARGPKPALTLEKIVRTAVRLADRDGLTALSMRNVAAELGVGTMSLYRYVPGKGELVALMVDHMNGPAEEVSDLHGKEWRPTLEQIADSAWKLYTTSPWLLQINQARPVLGPHTMAGLDVALQVMEGLPLNGQEKMGVLVALDNLVMGAARSHVLYQLAAQQSGVSDQEFWSTQEPYMVQAITEGAFPSLAALDDDAFSAEAVDSMRFGVKALLDGFEQLIASRGA
jgi:AcrR family transcriptional regulator